MPTVRPGTRCGRKGCDGVAEWQVTLLLVAAGAQDPPPRSHLVRAMLALGVCDRHRVDTAVEDVVGDAGWAQIVGGFDEVGMRRPDRARTTIEFDRVAEKA